MDAPPDPLDALIARLYRQAAAVAPERYRLWALEQAAALMQCEAALWGSGRRDTLRFHTVTTLGVPHDFPQQLESTTGINPLVPRLLSNLDTPLDMRSVLGDADFHASAIYQRVFAPLGIEHILATPHLDARSGLYSLVTLYRRAAERPFTPAERARQQRLTFHLFNAASHAVFLHLLRRSDRIDGAAAAVVDAHGLLHELQPRFQDLLDAHFPAHRGQPGLPFTLPAPGHTALHGALSLRCETFGDLFVLQLWQAGPLDRLTPREREVVTAVSQGLSFKQAARKIGVAPSTVANHLYRIYRKLGVTSRTELAALVHPEHTSPT